MSKFISITCLIRETSSVIFPVTMDCMLHCTCRNTKVYNIFRCVFVHQCINDTTHECISAADTVKNMESQSLALVSFPFNQRYAERLFSLQLCAKTYMSCNALDVWISLYKSFENFFLLITVRLEWNTIFYIASTMIFFIFPDMIWFNPKRTSTYGRQRVQKSLASSQLHRVLRNFRQS